MKPTLLIIAASLLAFAAGCDEVSQPSSDMRTAALESGVTLDVSADGQVLGGEVEPVLPNTDAMRVVTIDRTPNGVELNGRRVLDARMVGNDVLVIDPDHTLRRIGQQAAVVDRDVWPPLSIENGRVAYVKGHAPDLQLTIADLATLRKTVPMPSLLTVWSPALSEDGDEVVFGASVNGQAKIVHLDVSGETHIIDAKGRVPSSPIAPKWQDDRVTFHDEAGEFTVALAPSTKGGAR